MRDGFYYEFWVYILTSRTGTLYVGVIGYLGSHIMQHKIDSIEGFTSKFKIHRLVFYESYQPKRYSSRKAVNGLASREEDRAYRKGKPALVGPG